ncbi:helix-turn-helix domain-containing protein [Plantactinospora sp. CA-294935]|uniref:helix-turn-helix domain-containing protein n=1 Tax=Plantactinospora sp. CA-294935 TaxID=3240012 RepID=UPI003D8CFA05
MLLSPSRFKGGGNLRGNGAAVTVVRQARGWTQVELAARANISQGSVSKIESGQLDLEGEQLAQLAERLEVPPELLTIREPRLGVGVSCIHHRRRSSKLTATTTKRIEGLTHLVSLSVTRLTEELPGKLELKLPQLPGPRYTPTEAAQYIRSLIGVEDEPLDDLIGLVEKLGVVVLCRDLGTDAQDGVSLNLPERRPIIIVNTALPGDRQRLSVAHELGHLVLHGWHVATGEDSVERDAFEFAGELLAPRAVLRDHLDGMTARDFRRLLELKITWGMSMAALIQQGLRLGVIQEQLHRTLRIKLNQLGWAKVEPGTVVEETPQLMMNVVDTHLDVMGRATDKVASTALMLPDPFARHYLTHRIDGVSGYRKGADGELA